ncbi:ABC transporter permease subunit [Sinirhodobacter huangdaonensis]|uniref:ABC transporter permease subunit n=1 Tax=Paenirhodobacter huangdaonensis TaxID=2501515 RepID=A0A3S3LQP6_9RHOB|nr:ABC transporter permease subunit [Sinirhodobacter huangdaonensis]RWR54708.1 ABC transporter permease subunit [Sinirhodobacter huangdaonensis]
MDVLITQMPRFLAAIWLTLWMFALIVAISTLAGLVLALLGARRGQGFGRVLSVATWLLRGVPELVVLLFCFLALPAAGLDLGANGSAILAFSLIGTAFIAEIFRAALSAVDPRLIEAARALGMGRFLRLLRVVLPLVMRTALTPWATYLAGAVKMLSLASAISVGEVMMVTRQSLAISTDPMALILFAGAVYAAIASIVMLLETGANRWLARRGPMVRHGGAS